MTPGELIRTLGRLTPEQKALPMVVVGYGDPCFVRVDEEQVYILCSSQVRGWLRGLEVNPDFTRAEMRSFFNRTSLVSEVRHDR